MTVGRGRGPRDSPVMSVRRLAVGALVLAALAGCGDGGSSTATAPSTALPSVPVAITAEATTAPSTTGGGSTMSTSAPVPITSGEPTTTGAPGPATTSSAVTTSPPSVTGATIVDAPTTTTAPGALILRANGLGTVLFGSEPDTVVAAITADLGAPTRDTGWMDPLSLG